MKLVGILKCYIIDIMKFTLLDENGNVAFHDDDLVRKFDISILSKF